jgi:Ca2+-binding RTX toxin-like protein
MGRINLPPIPWVIYNPLTEELLYTVTAATEQSTIQQTVTAVTTAITTGITTARDGLISGVDSLIGRSSTTSLSQSTTLLVGSIGDDVLIGSSGNDTLMGSQKSTSLIGLGGADVFVVQNKTTLDQVIDFTDGQDKLMLSGSLTFGQLSVIQQGQDTLISANNTPLMLLRNVSSTLITAADIT